MSSHGPRGLAKLGLLTPRRAYVLNNGRGDLDLGNYECSLSPGITTLQLEKSTKVIEKEVSHFYTGGGILE